MKTTTEITLKPADSDFIVALDFQNTNEPRSLNIEVASVGDLFVSFNPEAAKRQQEALETASLIETVTSPAEQKLAISTVSVLKAFTTTLEKSRKEVKEPFWNAGKAIDEIAKKESRDALSEISRVEKLLGTYQREQDRIANEAREAAAAAERKQQAEAAAKLAEEQRLRDEADRLAREAQEAAQRRGKAAQAQADLARSQAEAALAKANTIAADRRADETIAKYAPAVAAPVVEARPNGTINRQNWEIEVTDWVAFHRAFGFRFIKCELDLQAFKYYLGGEGVDHTSIPGVKVTPVTNVRVRAAK